MRTKDDEKQDALFRATVKLVNEIGFVSSSVSKIAKEASVSPATIYVYYKNKEDLLVSTYIDIKQKFSTAVINNFGKDIPIRDILRNFWYSMFNYSSKHPEYFQFTEQFANSPYSSLVNKEEVESYFNPMTEIMQKGIREKIIKNVNVDLLMAFMFYPIMGLSNARSCKNFEINDENIETAFTMAWDAIKL